MKEIMLQANELLVKGLISQATFEKVIYGLKLQSQDKLLSNRAMEVFHISGKTANWGK